MLGRGVINPCRGCMSSTFSCGPEGKVKANKTNYLSLHSTTWFNNTIQFSRPFGIVCTRICVFPKHTGSTLLSESLTHDINNSSRQGIIWIVLPSISIHFSCTASFEPTNWQINEEQTDINIKVSDSVTYLQRQMTTIIRTITNNSSRMNTTAIAAITPVTTAQQIS